MALIQFVSVLRSTERGTEFRQRFLLVLGDLIDCLSSDLTRQVLVDATACTVKLGNAMFTPEMEQFLEQVTIWACRMLEALSSGRVKQGLFDVQQLVWATCALWADPQTIAALAEVTAYLCYALEMEDAILDGNIGAGLKSNANVPTHEKSKLQQQKKQQRHRKNRNEFQKTTFQNRILIRNPNTTLEEAILSSLSPGIGSSRSTLSRDDEPQQQRQTKPNTRAKANQTSAQGRQLSSTSQHEQPQQYDDGDQRDGGRNDNSSVVTTHWDERARKDVNVAYLREQIAQRPHPRRTTTMRSRPSDNHTTADDPTELLCDMEDGPDTTTIRQVPSSRWSSLPSSQNTNRRQRKRNRIPITTTITEEDEGDDEKTVPNVSSVPTQTSTVAGGKKDRQGKGDNEQHSSTRPVLPPKKEDETSTRYFYRVLNEVLAAKREQGVDRILTEADGQTTTGPLSLSFWTRPGRVRTRSPPQQHSKHERQSLDSIRHRLNTLRTELNKQQQQERTLPGRSQLPTPSFFQRNKVVVLLVLACSFLLGMTWFGLGCYGIYVLVYQPSAPQQEHFPNTAPTETRRVFEEPSCSGGSNGSRNEVVIRIVREVVHVDSDGRILAVASDPPADGASRHGAVYGASDEATTAPNNHLAREEMDHIADCIADAVHGTVA